MLPPLVAVLLLNGDAAMTGVLQAAQTLPFLLLSLPARLMANRLPRRVLMAGAEVLRSASLLTVLLLEWGGVSLQLLAGFGFLGAVGTVHIAWRPLPCCPRWWRASSFPAPTDGWNWRAAKSLPPALGGALVSGSGFLLAYGLATVLSLLAVVLLAGLPSRGGLSGCSGPFSGS